MYYFQASLSLIFLIGFLASLIYLLSISIKVATHLLDRKEAVRKSFLVSFFTWMSMFVVYFVWQDRSNRTFASWIMVTLMMTGISLFAASLIALGLSQWTKQ